ncbi:hypothetical protein, partial [Streptomyces sp. SID3915]|uniref:hypothetical protein n=1 Tax=Streptomyces sp. SID3915 TaxID=2690263 RepID=UPI0013691855
MARRVRGEAADRLLRCAAVFLPAPLPRDGRIAFWDPEGGVDFTGGDGGAFADEPFGGGTSPDADGATPSVTELTVVARHGAD